MSIRELNENLNVISMLDDEPNDEGGLSSAELKAKFDESAGMIKRYINETLIPDVGDTIADAINSISLASGNMPLGGTAGQVLTKASASDFDTVFADLPPFPVIPDPLDIVTTSSLTTSAGSVIGLAGSSTVEETLTTLGKRAIRSCTSSTSAATTAKTAALSGFVRETGSMVQVTFSNTNSAASPTLNVGGTGAASIRYANAALSAPGAIAAGIPHLFMFDGSYWQLLNPYTGAIYVSGSYSGDGAATRDIIIGATPQAVFLSCIGYSFTGDSTQMAGSRTGLAITGIPASPNFASSSAPSERKTIEIITNGFSVRYNATSPNSVSNQAGRTYVYVALL